MVIFRRGSVVGLALALAMSLVPGPAAADVVSRRDPKDTPGRLDIRRVGHGHAADDTVTHTITTYRRFSSRLLRPRTAVFVILTVGPNDEGRIIAVWWRNGRLRAPVFDLETERRIGSARVTRPNRRAVRVILRVDQLGDLGDPARYWWIASSAFRNQGRCKEPDRCVDFAPNRRMIQHRLPEVPPEEPEAGNQQEALAPQHQPGDPTSLLRTFVRRW